MKYLIKNGHVNFIDDNDTFVGYDLNHNCCETADWYIDTFPNDSTDLVGSIRDISSYLFDREYFTESTDNCDCGGLVRFRMTSPSGQDLYLHLYNVHNGYYAHDFEVKHSGIVVKSDSL
jgi:hypothetical protein